MIGDGRPTTDDGYRLPAIRRPLSFRLVLLNVLLVAAFCVGLTTLDAQRIDLFHAVVFDSCEIRAYQLHWQDRRRYPDPVRYGFATSPVSFALVEIWLEDGPTISFSREIPLACPEAEADRPVPSGGWMK